jgi:hypothetical protein
VLSEGAELDPDDVDGLAADPSLDDVDGLAADPSLDDVDGLAAEAAPELPAWVPVACLAVSAGSWPLTRTPNSRAHVARKSATVSATIVRRMVRVRARRAARRG